MLEPLDVRTQSDATIARVVRPGTAAAQAFESLRDAIASLRLRPGQSFSEQEVARQLGVSRTPVREAVIRLAESGLIEVLPQRGTVVRKISRKAVEDAHFLRKAIEVAVVREAATRSLPATVFAAARGLIDAQRAAANGDDLQQFLALDDALHRSIAHATGRKHVWSMVEMQKTQMDRVRFLALAGAVPYARIIEQHEAILEAIERGDAAASEAALHAHLAETTTVLEPLRRQHPDLFEPETR
ncbi:MAG: GntR family transcriptional regulator [Geminicoccaceae bacterium]